MLSVLPLVLRAQPSDREPMTSNPLPAAVEKRGLAAGIADIAQLPDTRGLLPEGSDPNPSGIARTSMVQESPDGRRFVNDQRGLIYVLDEDNEPSLYLDMHDDFPLTTYNRVQSGFSG